MKKIFNYLPLHFVVCVILGILVQFYTGLWAFGFLKLGATIISFLIILYFANSKILRTVFAFLLFFLVGVSSVFVNDNHSYVNYYKDFLNDDSTVILKVDKVLKPGNYNNKYQAKVIQVDANKVIGKVLLNISKDSFSNLLKVDELVYAKPEFIEVNSPLNPHQFNYKAYLEKQGIQQQLFLKNNQYKSLGVKGFSLSGFSAKIRKRIQKSLKKYQFKNDELAVINALLLGQRQGISKELSANYSKAGAIHILAVSGLHVGIILLILSNLFKPLEQFKNGKIIKTVIIVLFLWMFAFIAGLSASVVRAVTMFTFLAFGLSFQRKKVVAFSLISSMFFLLIFKPMFLFDVGFQLSYLAVFGIILIQPKLYNVWKPRYRITNKFWQLTTVSIAAQIGVLPLSLYYFHQFPGLFMLSNLVIIPCLGAILIGGILIIAFALIGILPEFLAKIYGFIISLMNGFVSWISHQEQFLLQEISLSFYTMFLIYLAIIFCVAFAIKKTSKSLVYALVSIFLLQSIFLLEKYQKKSKKEFVVFHKSRKSILGTRIGNIMNVNHNLDSLEIAKANAIISYRIGENVHQTYKKEISNIFKFKNQSILVIDSLGVYRVKSLVKPIVILQNSPKINMERLLKILKPKQIIADGSNYKSYVNRWRETCRKQKTPFYSTGQNGAFILK